MAPDRHAKKQHAKHRKKPAKTNCGIKITNVDMSAPSKMLAAITREIIVDSQTAFVARCSRSWRSSNFISIIC